MKKESYIIFGLLIIIIALGIGNYYFYNQNKQLNSEISQLNLDKEQLFNEKEQVLAENKEIWSQLGLLKQDVAEIYKTCVTENACKGHYPGVRWYCNNVGDESDIETASHTCECDSSCKLTTTQLKNI